jgi:hypothetical protein
VEKEVKTGRRERRRHRLRWRHLGVRRQMYLLVLLGFALIATAGIALVKSAPVSANGWKTDVIHTAQAAVRDVVRDDLRTSFGGPEETQLASEEGGKYLVSGWVDLIADGGQIERQIYSCVIYKNRAGDWAHEKVSVLPQ